MNDIKIVMLSVFGVIGGTIASLLGGWSEDLATLIIVMGIDIVMGFLISAVWKKSSKSISGALSSASMWKGLCRKGVTLLIILVAYRLDLAIGTNYIRTAVIIAFIVNELVSIVENACIMGIPIPKVIVKAIDILKQKEDTIK